MPFVRFGIHNLLRDHAVAFEEIRRHDLDWTVGRTLILTNGPWTGSYRVVGEGLPCRGFTISSADVADFMLRQVGSDEYVAGLLAIAY